MYTCSWKNNLETISSFSFTPVCEDCFTSEPPPPHQKFMENQIVKNLSLTKTA